MPLNTSQIQKLNSIPNRIKIFGEFDQDLQEKKRNYRTNRTSFYAYDFIINNLNEILKSPLSSIRNDLNTWPGFLDFTYPQYQFNGKSSDIPIEKSLLDITPERVIAGYVTSGTGVLTDKYLNSLEICYIEDETGGIGVMFNHGISSYDSIPRPTGDGYVDYSYLKSKTFPLEIGSTTTGFNLLSDDYRHNLMIGDLVIISSGEYIPGPGRTFDGTPTWLVNADLDIPSGRYGRYYSMQGPSYISNIKDFIVDTEFRGISPTPLDRNIFPLPSAESFKFVSIGDNRLVRIRQTQFVKDPITLEPFPTSHNVVFEPSKSYWLTSDLILQTWGEPIEVCISPFSELSRFSVRVPDRPIDISGILVQDSARDKRVLFPRFLRDIYGRIYEDL